VTLSDIWTGSDKVAKETGCSNLMILTCDFEGNETVKGKDIVFLPIWKCLLPAP